MRSRYLTLAVSGFLALVLLTCGQAQAALSVVGCEGHAINNTPDRTVSVPVGTADGDTMLAFYHHHPDDVQPVTLTGWTETDQLFDANSDDVTIATWIRTASAEPASYTFNSDVASTGNGTAIICTFTEADGLDVVYARASHFVRQIDDTTPTAQPITTETANAMVVIFSEVSRNNITDMQCPSSGGTWTEHIQLLGGANQQSNVCTHTQATAGTVTPGSSDHTGISALTDDTSFFTLAVKEQVAAAGSAAPHRRRM